MIALHMLGVETAVLRREQRRQLLHHCDRFHSSMNTSVVDTYTLAVKLRYH
jgi:hypothetical protein